MPVWILISFDFHVRHVSFVICHAYPQTDHRIRSRCHRQKTDAPDITDPEDVLRLVYR